MKKIISYILIMLSLMQTVTFAADLSSWAEEDYISANSAGLVSFDIIINNMHENITRGEFCDLAVNLYKSLTNTTLPEPTSSPFVDCTLNSVAQAYELGIVSGMSETEFMPNSFVTREQMAKMLVSTLLKADIDILISKSDKTLLTNYVDGYLVHDWAQNSVITLLKEGIMNGLDATTLAPLGNTTREQAIALTNRTYKAFTNADSSLKITEINNIKNNSVLTTDLTCTWSKNPKAKEYRVILKDDTSNAKIVYTTKNLTATIPAEKLTNNKNYSVLLQTTLLDDTQVFSLPIDFKTNLSTPTPTISPDKVSTTPTPTSSTGKAATTEKELRIFKNGHYFTTKEDASNYMVDITVDVWKIDSDGKKYASTLPLTIHCELAEDVKKIFSEIFADESQFPIKSIGGFQWRNSASGRPSQHSYGTCIDINPNENYYVSKNGVALSGSHWKPYEDPYSITADGIVVKTFAKYGFLWGGDAWGENSAKDYMHFTYLGN